MTGYLGNQLASYLIPTTNWFMTNGSEISSYHSSEISSLHGSDFIAHFWLWLFITNTEIYYSVVIHFNFNYIVFVVIFISK